MPDDLADLINKRLTLNLLIQGAAAHAFLGAHYLVEPELSQLDPLIFSLYDQFTTGAFLLFWYGESDGIRQLNQLKIKHIQSSDLFGQHPLFAKHGELLSDAARQYMLDTANERRLSVIDDFHSDEVMEAFHALTERETCALGALSDLALRTAAQIWGFDRTRLRGEIAEDCEVGNVRTPQTEYGSLIRANSGGWSCVERENGRLVVTAKGSCWPMLCHELVKGVAEIVCLNGLNMLDRETYASIIDVTDHIEFEPWMTQVGPELWRRFLKVKPRDRLPAHLLMEVAKLEPESLQRLMISIVEEPELAARWLASL